MKEMISSADLVSLIRQVGKDIVDQKAFLAELDSAFGDGDLGVTLTLGMNGIEEGFSDLEDKDIGTILMRSGMNFNRAASSTFGTIFSKALINAGTVATKKNEISPHDMILMLEAAEKGVKDIGKAEVGDKTVLDALVPMREAFEEAIGKGEGFEAALDEAYRATEQAVENTKNMKSKAGRGRWLGERSVGHPDPGATALLLMLRSFVANLKTIQE